MDKTIPKDQLRKRMRTRRFQLSSQQQLNAAFKLVKYARQSYQLLNANRILSYFPFAGEISPKEVVCMLPTQNIYFPRITNFRNSYMQFYRTSKLERMNKYGIIEPANNTQPLAASAFDAILLPVVAFDRTGARLGMGAGYYDRALAALAHQSSTKPYLVGLAHHFQEVNSIESAPWDVGLDAILTDQEFIQI